MGVKPVRNLSVIARFFKKARRSQLGEKSAHRRAAFAKIARPEQVQVVEQVIEPV
jgi:hypothetical protein